MLAGDKVAISKLGSDSEDISAKLFEEGVFAAPIVFPMVAKGKARVRVITSASFSKADCDAGLAAFKKVKAALA